MGMHDESDALRRTVDLMARPYVVDVLDALHHGRQPAPHSGTQAEQGIFDSAVDYLVAAGVLAHREIDTVGDPPSPALSLTDTGREIAAIVMDLTEIS